MRAAIVAGIVALASSTPALAQDRPSEDEMFGDAPAKKDEPKPAPSGQGPASHDDEIFGAPSAAPSPENPSIMAREEEALAIGGQLFLRLNDTYRDGMSVSDTELSSPSLADVFADVRPNDRVRGFAQVRLSYDFTVTDGEKNQITGQTAQQFTFDLDQMWMKFDIGRVAYITAGRQHIRWGTGRFWNPTDFVNTEVRNSVDFFDNRLGVNLIKVHFPFEQLGWNLYLLGVLDGVDVLNKSGVAARAEFSVGPGELALSSLVKNNAPLRFGIDASAGVWLFDLRAEATLQRGLDTPRFEGDLDFTKGTLPSEQKGTDNDWFFRGVFGGDFTLKYNDQDNIIIGGEYFYNQAGYDSASIYPFLALKGAFTPLYLGKHYVGAYLVAASPLHAWTNTFKDTSLTLSTLTNISDGSYLSRLDIQQVFLTNLTVNVFGAVHYGNEGELKLGVHIPKIPAVPALANGVDIADELVDVGVALRVSL